jgi:hypothetical protein
VDFTGGNPDVELRGGIGFQNGNGVILKSGTGTWRFTTNNQSIGSAGYITFDCPIEIVGAIYVVLYDLTTHMVVNNVINGTVAGSLFINQGIFLYNTMLSLTSFSVGSLDRLTYDNVVGYNMPGNLVIPYSTYRGLWIGGSGLKTLPGNTVANGMFILAAGPIADGFDAETYNLEISGQTQLRTGTFYKTGAGSLIFGGQLYFGYFGNVQFILSGNPTVEIRGGIYFQTIMAGGNFNPGTQPWVFTTNNQTLGASGSIYAVFPNSFLISGPITLTNATLNLQLYGTLDGNHVNSKFENKYYINYTSATMPMVTGILETNSAYNHFVYGGGNQDVKGGTYFLLEFGGSGIKTLQGNVVINATGGGAWWITGTATINYNGFTITTI